MNDGMPGDFVYCRDDRGFKMVSQRDESHLPNQPNLFRRAPLTVSAQTYGHPKASFMDDIESSSIVSSALTSFRYG